MAGVDDPTIEQCPLYEQRQYANLGIFVFTSFLLSALVFGYLTTLFTESTLRITAISIIAGLFIAGIDRLIMMKLVWRGTWKATFLFALPRVVVTLFLGFIVGEAVSLNIFNPEVEQQLALDRGKTTVEITSRAAEAFGEIDKLKASNKNLNDEIKEKEKERDAHYTAFIGEAEGRSGTMIYGKGPVFHEKKEEYDLIQSELEKFRQINLQAINQNSKRISQLEAARDTLIAQSQAQLPTAEGLLQRIHALDEYTFSHTTLIVWRMLIILFFCVLDCTPVLVKLFSISPQHDIYEIKLLVRQASVAETEEEGRKTDVKIKQESEKIRNQQSLRVAEETYKNVANAQIELMKKHVDQWYKSQLNTVMFDNHVQNN